MPSADERVIPLLEKAISSEFGIKVNCSDAERLRRRIYILRKKDPRFASLVLRISPHERNELWILKGEEESPQIAAARARKQRI